MIQYNDINEDQLKIEAIMDRHNSALSKRDNWESHWQECYDYALPQRGGTSRTYTAGSSRTQTLYDGTALDAVDQLAASLLGNLTPTWSQWFGFKPGPDVKPDEIDAVSKVLEESARIIQTHLDHSNFSVEMHQCFLDLAVGGTSTLCFEETPAGNMSAFKFSAVPLQDIVLEEGDNGFLNGSYRQLALNISQMKARYGAEAIPDYILSDGERDTQRKFDVLETILPQNDVYYYNAILTEGTTPTLLKTGQFDETPIISFRWMKSPGESYGRSPVMKALPDIKTANKVVELILKNASIAVTGIWQADDDGVLNPANIELVPGAIIPKAVGSQGLRPLDMPGRFDVSELVLKDLRSRIRHALLADKLNPLGGGKMTATEILERSAEMALLLGATYGRLQSELLTPLIKRAYSILRRRGEIADIALDGRFVTLDCRSPLARAQGQRDAQNVLTWVQSMSSLGAESTASIDTKKVTEFLANTLAIPNDFIKNDVIPPEQI